MFELRAASATACTAVNGGATTISTSVMSFTALRSSFTNTTASCTVLYIFQLPAMKGIRIGLVGQVGRVGQVGGTDPPGPPGLPRPHCHSLSAKAATPGSVR